MGHDVISFGDHNLNTTSVKTLALDLSKRLNVNIEYGFTLFDQHALLLERELSDSAIILGTIHAKDKEKPTYRLIDDNYTHKLLYQKYGFSFLEKSLFWEGLFHNPDDKIENWEKENEKKKVNEIEYNLIIDDYADIIFYVDYYDNNIPQYNSRWWTFCRAFVEEKTDHYSLENSYESNLIHEFRILNQHWARLLGGSKVYYGDDQSKELRNMCIIYEDGASFAEIEQYVKEKAGALLLNVSKYRLSRTYKDTFIQNKNYPLCFVDDFKDIN